MMRLSDAHISILLLSIVEKCIVNDIELLHLLFYCSLFFCVFLDVEFTFSKFNRRYNQQTFPKSKTLEMGATLEKFI